MTRQKLRAWRARLGHSQDTLAKELGITRETVNRYERGKLAIPQWLVALVEGPKPRKRGR